MPITIYQSNKILNYYFGKRISGTSPNDDFYLGFSTTTTIQPSWDGAALMAFEPRGTSPQTGYSRILIPNNITQWSISTLGELVNEVPIVTPIALSSWGTIYSYFLADASINGNLLYYQILDTPITLEANRKLTFLEGSLKIRMVA